MKKLYIKPELKISVFRAENVVTESVQDPKLNPNAITAKKNLGDVDNVTTIEYVKLKTVR